MTDAQAKQHWMDRRHVAVVTKLEITVTQYSISVSWRHHVLKDGVWQWIQDYVKWRMSDRKTWLVEGEVFEIE